MVDILINYNINYSVLDYSKKQHPRKRGVSTTLQKPSYAALTLPPYVL